MHEEKGIEDLILKNTTKEALERFSDALDWPPHILFKYPDPKVKLIAALKDYFSWAKGNWGIADFLGQCSEAEIPSWIRDACVTLTAICDPLHAAAAPPVPPAPPPSNGAEAAAPAT
jgi:putative ATP-dependent endonuclease of OLD family